MNTRWSKIVRDVWLARARAGLVVVAIAIGLSGFLAVLSTYAILKRELNRGYLATNPASAVLRTDAIDASLIASVSARDDIADADARRVLTGRVRCGDGVWRRLTLFVIRDFDHVRISTFTPEGGDWPPSPGSVLIERDAFQVARARLGDVVMVQTAAGRETPLRVSGGVHDAGQAQARMENIVYGYVTLPTVSMLGEEPTLDRLYLSVDGDRFDEAHVRRVASAVKASLEASGHPVRRVDVPTPGEHPHSVIMNLLLVVMAAFGVFALVLSGLIVVNLLLSMMTNERRQIGVMKAMGGTRRQVAAIYLTEAGLFGVAAVVLATPIGIVGGRALSRYFGVLLNFDLESMAVPMWVFALVGVVGLLVPLAAALYPVAAGTAITAREAMAASGLDPAKFGSSRFDRLLTGVGGARPLLLGARNSMRRRTRTLLAVITLTIAGAFFISAVSYRASMMATFDRLFGVGTYGSDARYTFDQHMLMIYVFLIVMAGILAIIGSLGLMTSTSLNVLDRRRELGVMRAIGGSPAMVGGIVIVEAVFVVLIAWCASVLLAWLITAALGQLMSALMTLIKVRTGMDVVLSRAAIAGGLGIAVVLAVLASLVPAISAARRSIREAIGYE